MIKKMVFISHAPEDKDKALSLIELLESMGLNENDILSSSVAGYSAPINCNKYEYLLKKFTDNHIFVLYLISSYYYKSIACLNEMGAIWVLKNEYTSILLSGYQYTDLNGAIDPNRVGLDLSGTIDEIKIHMEELKKLLTEYMGLKCISYTKWERIRDEFLFEVKNHTNTDIPKENDIDYIKKELMVPGKEITLKSIILLGYSETKSKNILNRLIAEKSVKRIHYGRYKWSEY